MNKKCIKPLTILDFYFILRIFSLMKFKIIHFFRFPIDFNDIGIYVNDEKTRTFIALKVGVGYHQLTNCVSAIDQCLSEFRLPTYYEVLLCILTFPLIFFFHSSSYCFFVIFQDPSFHLSLIWCVGDKKEELTRLIPVLKSQYLSLIEDDLQSQFVYVTRVCCKTGNRLFKFELKW